MGVWEEIGQVLKEFYPPVVWKLPSDQMQIPSKIAECLKEHHSVNSRDGQLTAVCWTLANAYRTMVLTLQHHLQSEGKVDGAVVEPMDVMAVQAPAKPQGQPQPAVVAPVQRRKYKAKSVCLVNNTEVSGPSQPVEEPEPKIITESLLFDNLRSL